MRFINGRLVIEKLTMRAVAFSRQSGRSRQKE